MDRTNQEAFCISCHEMEANVYQEYKKTIHYSNRTGVRATCPDCHVPKQWTPMLARKIGATNELFHKLIGSIDTREKFEARRLYLAGLVWKSMKRTDSRECRNCHSFNSMDLAKQSRLARRKHIRSAKEGGTCIDCHMGISHQLPRDFDEDGSLHETFKRKGVACDDCHKGMTQAPD